MIRMYRLSTHTRHVLSLATILLGSEAALAQSSSLQDIGGKVAGKPLPKVTIYKAKEIVTLDPGRAKAQAVAVVGDRILATGNVQELKAAAGDQEFSIDETFADKVIVPGFIAQHDHPVLTALTMASEVLSIEDWVLPTRTIPAVKDRADFLQRLAEAEKKMSDSDKPLVTWGYHPSFTANSPVPISTRSARIDRSWFGPDRATN